jgi:hypothetical protein
LGAPLSPTWRAGAAGDRLRIVNAVTGLAILPASIVAGLLWNEVGQAAPFWFGACAAGGLVLLPSSARLAADVAPAPRRFGPEGTGGRRSGAGTIPALLRA